MTVSTEIRTLIVKQHKKGKTPMEISDNLEVDLRTVQRIVKQYNETGDVTPKVSTGRHRLLSPRDERELLLTMRREPPVLLPSATLSAPRSLPVLCVELLQEVEFIHTGRGGSRA